MCAGAVEQGCAPFRSSWFLWGHDFVQLARAGMGLWAAARVCAFKPCSKGCINFALMLRKAAVCDKFLPQVAVTRCSSKHAVFASRVDLC